MLPEISHRCRSCGAAVRAGARFCPQCGAAMGDEPSAAPETREAEPTRDWTPPTREFEAFAQSQAAPGPSVARAEDEPRRAFDDEPRLAADDAPAPDARPYVAAEPPLAEAGAAAQTDGADGVGEAADAADARGRVARVREGTRARVERMREEAIVVLEETPDDSGFRFVVAAAALFAVFIILLFLSTTVLR